MKENRHINSIPDNVVAEANQKLAEINELLKPYFVPLTPKQRRALSKMGDKSVGFVDKAHEFAGRYPELVPPFINMVEFGKDFKDAHGLWGLGNNVRQLENNISDTQMVAGNETNQFCLAFYDAVKLAAKQNVPGAKAVYEELKAHFPSSRRKKASAEAGQSGK